MMQNYPLKVTSYQFTNEQHDMVCLYATTASEAKYLIGKLKPNSIWKLVRKPKTTSVSQPPKPKREGAYH